MTELDQARPGDAIPQETLKNALKAFKKRLKLTTLDEDSRLGRGPFSGGRTGDYAIRPPDQYPQEIWQALCRQGKLRDSGHGMYELPRQEHEKKNS